MYVDSEVQKVLKVIEEMESHGNNNGFTNIWVSEISQCLRRSYLARKQRPKYDIQTKIKMLIGSGLHKELQKLLKDKQFEIEKRVELNLNDFTIVGKVDVYDPTEKVVYELKYTHEEKLDKEILNIYLRQLRYYIEMTGANAGYLVIFHSDGTIETRKRFYERSNLVYRAFKLYTALKYDMMPPKHSFDKECEKCPFRSFCWGRNGLKND